MTCVPWYYRDRYTCEEWTDERLEYKRPEYYDDEIEEKEDEDDGE